jgi:glucose uptake protein GlcU
MRVTRVIIGTVAIALLVVGISATRTPAATSAIGPRRTISGS